MNRITRTLAIAAAPTIAVAGFALTATGLVGAAGGDPAPQLDAAPTTTLAPATTLAPPTTAIPNLPPGSSTTAPTASTVAPSTAPAATSTVAVQLVEDSTGLLNVEIPVAWTDVDTRQNREDSGQLIPMIAASTDLDSFLDTFDAPGMLYGAFPAGSDINELLQVYDWPGELCQDGGVTPYDDGVFVGSVQAWRNCDGGPASAYFLAATPPTNTFTAWLFVQTATDADLPAYQHILDTFNFDPAAPVPTQAPATTAPGATSVPGAPTTSPTVTTTPTGPATTAAPATTVPPVTGPATTSPTVPPSTTPVPTAPASTTPGSTVAPGFQTLTDDTGRLSLSVPVAWTDIDTTSQDFEGTVVAAIGAAPDLEVFSDTFDGSGVVLFEMPYAPDPATELATHTFSCTDGGVQPLPNPGFTGVYQTWNDCGGSQTDLYFVVANPVGGEQTTVAMLLQVTPADQAVVPTILSAFTLNTAV